MRTIAAVLGCLALAANAQERAVGAGQIIIINEGGRIVTWYCPPGAGSTEECEPQFEPGQAITNYLPDETDDATAIEDARAVREQIERDLYRIDKFSRRERIAEDDVIRTRAQHAQEQASTRADGHGEIVVMAVETARLASEASAGSRDEHALLTRLETPPQMARTGR